MQTDLVFSECQILIILEHIYVGFNSTNGLLKAPLLTRPCPSFYDPKVKVFPAKPGFFGSIEIKGRWNLFCISVYVQIFRK